MAETIKRQFGRLPVFRGPWTSDIESSDVHKFNRYTYLGSEFISTVEGNALSPGEIVNGKLVEHEGWKVTANGTDPGLEAKANIETLANEAVQDAITNTNAAKDAALEAAEAANAAKDSIDTKIDNKANKDGYYGSMTVGSAENLVGNQQVSEEFTTTVISGTDGLAKINDVRGNSLVWNQLVQNGNFVNNPTYSDATGSVADNICTFTVTSANGGVRFSWPSTLGHKYLLSAEVKLTTATDKVVLWSRGFNLATIAANTNWQKVSNLVNVPSSPGNEIIVVRDERTSDWDAISVRNFQCIDLTLMFGSGNEPATVEEFESLFPLPYYDYNAGEIISNKTEQVKVVGFNQWDEEWEVGGINTSTGGNTGDTNKIRSKNYNDCFPGITYYFKSPNTAQVFFYDGNKLHLGNAGIASGGSFAPPAGCRYFRLYVVSAYGTTYNHDICINLSDASRNGTYEPYKTNTIELNLPTLTGKVNGEGESVVIASDGLKSAGSVYDEGIVENGYLTKIVKRIGVVDMGTLTWTKATSGKMLTMLTDGKKTGALTGISTAICSKYEVYTQNYSAPDIPDKIISVGNISASPANCGVVVNDTLYYDSDAATFKTAMSGVLLYYELAEPVTYVLDTPIPATFQSYKGGTLKQIPENGSVPTTAPHAMSVTYAIDAAGILTGLPQNYVSKESLQAMLTAMQSAGIFANYTMTYNSTTGKYEFTFTANNS